MADPNEQLNGLYFLKDKSAWSLSKGWEKTGSGNAGSGGVREGVPVYTSPEAPVNQEAIWVAPTLRPNSGHLLETLLSRLGEALKRIEELEYAVTMKLDAGGFDNSVRAHFSQGRGTEPGTDSPDDSEGTEPD